MRRFVIRAFAYTYVGWGALLVLGLPLLRPISSIWHYYALMAWGTLYMIGMAIVARFDVDPSPLWVQHVLVISSAALVLSVVTTAVASLVLIARPQFVRRPPADAR